MKVAGIDAEESVEMIWKIARASLANANDADLVAVDDADGQFGETRFQRESREQAGASAAEDDDILNHLKIESTGFVHRKLRVEFGNDLMAIS